MMTAKTQLVALIGDPVAHSLSPVMHNAAFSHLAMDWAYTALPVKAENLAQAVAGLRALGFQGFNATMPHKQALAHGVDELDEFARFCGAVNTVTIREGTLTGYDTDGPGALNALTEAGADLARCVILGAGAAGSAMALALAHRGSEIRVLNRDVRKAQELAQKIRKAGFNAQADSLNQAQKHAKDATVLCNATSVGMNTRQSPVEPAALHDGLTVLDAVYSPRRTRLLQDAEKAGCATITGDRMLLHQGMIGFWRWTGCKAPQAAMEEALDAALKANEQNGLVKK